MYLVVLHRNVLGEHTRVVFQRPVKRFTRNTLRHQPSQHQADRPQQQDGREHPIENFAEQRALFALEDFQFGIFSRQ